MSSYDHGTRHSGHPRQTSSQQRRYPSTQVSTQPRAASSRASTDDYCIASPTSASSPQSAYSYGSTSYPTSTSVSPELSQCSPVSTSSGSPATCTYPSRSPCPKLVTSPTCSYCEFHYRVYYYQTLMAGYRQGTLRPDQMPMLQQLQHWWNQQSNSDEIDEDDEDDDGDDDEDDDDDDDEDDDDDDADDDEDEEDEPISNSPRDYSPGSHLPTPKFRPGKLKNLPQEFFCLFNPCTYSCARKADLERHVSVTHVRDMSIMIDCDYPGCHRRGAHGFMRKDKMTDHKREVHKCDIPKRPMGKRGSSSSQGSGSGGCGGEERCS